MATSSLRLCTPRPPIPEASPPEENPLDSQFAVSAAHSSLLNSNEPIPDGISHSVESVISEIDERMRRLEDEHFAYYLRTLLSTTWEKSTQLGEEEYEALLKYRAQNLAVISPLRRLPFEVLAEIFSWTLRPVSEVGDRYGGFDRRCNPWALTHVCRRWRAVAISSPALWSLFMLVFNDDDASYDYPLDMIETQLERARNLKIHFYGSETADSQAQIDIFRYLAAHAARWEVLDIELTSDLVPLLATLQGRLPALRRLSIGWDNEESQAGVHSIDSFQSAPLLVDVAVYAFGRFVSVPVRFNQLTGYNLDAPWSIHHTLLAAAPNLVDARVTIIGSEPRLPRGRKPIQLLSLRRLFVSDLHILVHLHVPVMEELALRVRDGGGPAIVERLQDIPLKKDSPGLRNLHFDGCPDAHSMIVILHHLPLITELAISIDQETFHELAEVMDELSDPHIAPKLCCLSLRCQTADEEPGTPFDNRAYLQMVQSRWNSPSSALERVELVTDAHDGFDSKMIDAITVLREEELELVFLELQEGTLRHICRTV
ncbi:hypothetical protein C8R46DRAFT_1005110 [Mycena filopes]|nr:hypothetical protein C8R46DRAFT_1005110 [Mycena filopes]